MSDPFVAFRWDRPTQGVRVVEGIGQRFEGEPVPAEREGAFLVAQDGPAEGYEPLARGAELLEALVQAARGPAEPEDLAALASEWGRLGLPTWRVLGRVRPLKKQGRSERIIHPDGSVEVVDVARARARDTVGGESVEDWRRELAALLDAAELARAIREVDAGYLAEPVSVPVLADGEWTPGERPRLEVAVGSAAYNAPAQVLALRVGGEGSALAPLLTPEEPLRAAALVLGQILKARLAALTTYGPAFDAQGGELEPSRLRPRSLLGAAWVLLDRARAGEGLDVRRCEECGAPFIADSANERGHARKYCLGERGERCRKRLDKRKRRARRLSEAGEKPAAIAKRLGKDVATVRAWLREGSRTPSGRKTKARSKRR